MKLQKTYNIILKLKNNNFKAIFTLNIGKYLNNSKIKRVSMDSKGIINLELLFCTLIIILLLIITFPILEQNLNSNIEIDENAEGRLLLNHIADSINEVNSKGFGFNKKIKLPESINDNHYTILVKNNEVILEFNNKKGKSNIDPIKLVNANNKTIDSVQLYNGRTYLIKKTLINDNKTHMTNQSSIEIKQIEG